MNTDYRRYLQPDTVSKLKGMELRARMVVEGFIAGLHKSPYHGFSVEFAEHRQYVPGDDGPGSDGLGATGGGLPVFLERLPHSCRALRSAGPTGRG